MTLIEPLIAAASSARSPFLKCESIKLLSAIYKHDVSKSEEGISVSAKSEMKRLCSKVVDRLSTALGDPDLQKAKHRDEVLISTKQFITYLKAQEEGILTESDLSSLQDNLKTVGDKCNSGMKQLCSQVTGIITALPRKAEPINEPKLNISEDSKTPKKQKKKSTKRS